MFQCGLEKRGIHHLIFADLHECRRLKNSPLDSICTVSNEHSIKRVGLEGHSASCSLTHFNTFIQMDSQFAPEEDMDNTVDSYSVTINGFIFCTRHGLEVCDKCPTDNRGANNMIIEDSLHEKISEEEYSSWAGDDRTPFSVTHQWVRVSAGKVRTPPPLFFSYSGLIMFFVQPGCIKHKEVVREGAVKCENSGLMQKVVVS